MMGFELGTYEIKAHWFNAYRINKNWEKKSIMFMTSVINFRRINKSGAVLIKVLAEMQKYLNNSWVKSVREVTANFSGTKTSYQQTRFKKHQIWN